MLKTIHCVGCAYPSSYTPPIWQIALDEPKINKEEEKLPRKTRCTLAQLRSGYSITLNSYKNRLDPLVPEECPECRMGPHNVAHLFACPNKPTSLVPECLWYSPVEAAGFLGLEVGKEEDSDEVDLA